VESEPLEWAAGVKSTGDPGSDLDRANLRERFAQYGERTLMSEKQMASLRKIAGK